MHMYGSMVEQQVYLTPYFLCTIIIVTGDTKKNISQPTIDYQLNIIMFKTYQSPQCLYLFRNGHSAALNSR